ncbi:MAG: hypothetical protein O0X93_05715 [Methanocorpusculum sp.]|nr:hypothetical protein [Methanocorpusculum sp.]MDE2523786.1 hypothetical protein [Methanocorpusculum sp.]
MQMKNILILIIGIMLALSLVFGVIYLINSYPDEGLTVQMHDTIPDSIGEPHILTEEEYSAMPKILQISLGGGSHTIPITSNPFAAMKSRMPVISEEEAEELFSKYSEGFVWNGKYYGFAHMVS